MFCTAICVSPMLGTQTYLQFGFPCFNISKKYFNMIKAANKL